jgi:hypothetical protein
VLEGLRGLRYRRRMAIEVRREVLAGMLRQHGEQELAQCALSVSNDELARVGTLGGYYAWSDDAIALGGSMGGSRALSLASIDVLENTGRDLRLSRTEGEHRGSSVDRFAESDRVMDRELRRHAAERQIPADKRQRTLDVVDPPAWGPAPAGAPRHILRCHELRTKPLLDFTDDDLGFMIGQQVALNHLVGAAWAGCGPIRWSRRTITRRACWPACCASPLRIGNDRPTMIKRCATWLRVRVNGSSSTLKCASSSTFSTETIQFGV